MNQRPPPVFLLTGPPAAGKTATAEALAVRLPRAVHIPVDDMLGWVRSGQAPTTQPWTAETLRQLGLARLTAIQAAQSYHAAGFAVIIVDTILPEPAERTYGAMLGGAGLRNIVLLPAISVLQQRNLERASKSADTRQQLAALIPSSHANFMAAIPRLMPRWQVVDNGSLTIEQCCDEILLPSNVDTSALHPAG